MAAPKGNKNAAKAKLFEQALKRALARAHGSVDAGLDRICDVIVEQATVERDKQVASMIADRIDGKPMQSTELTGADGKDLIPTSLHVNFVKPK